jgi:hypothetical protein
MKTFFKVLALIFAILFAWAVYLQNNDPDASMWYIIYGLASVASLLFAIGRLTFTIAIFLCFLAIVGTYFLWPVKFEGFTIGKGEIENIERGREAFGLLIIAVVMSVYALRIRYEKKLKM